MFALYIHVHTIFDFQNFVQLTSSADFLLHMSFYILPILLYLYYFIYRVPSQEVYMAASVERPSVIPTTEFCLITDGYINRPVEDHGRPVPPMQNRRLSNIHDKT